MIYEIAIWLSTSLICLVIVFQFYQLLQKSFMRLIRLDVLYLYPKIIR